MRLQPHRLSLAQVIRHLGDPPCGYHSVAPGAEFIELFETSSPQVTDILLCTEKWQKKVPLR